MLKLRYLSALSRPKLLLWLLVLVLLLITLWQGVKLANLGSTWQALPQRMQATPLVDYAEQEAIRVLLADDSLQAQRLVNELIAAKLISAAQLYGEEGQLIATASQAPKKRKKTPSPHELEKAAAHLNAAAGLAYVRPLYQEQQPIGFLRLQLANNPLSLAQQGIWRQLEYHLSWLLPLCLCLGLLLGMALQHVRQPKS